MQAGTPALHIHDLPETLFQCLASNFSDFSLKKAVFGKMSQF